MVSVDPLSGVAQDFSSQVNYTVTAEDGKTQLYAVRVSAAGTDKAITSFDFEALVPTVVGEINEYNKTIDLTVPYGTELTALVPSITISAGASVSPLSGAAQDFSSQVNYTVTAEDASTAVYVVRVAVAQAPKAITSFDFEALVPTVVGEINEYNKTIDLTVPYGTELTALVPTIAISEKKQNIQMFPPDLIPGTNEPAP